MSGLVYRQRRNALEEECEWRLEPSALAWKFLGKNGGDGRIGFSDISKVKLSYEPNRITSDRYVLKLETQSSCFEIGNVYYRGFGDLEPRTEAFREFVDQLLAQLNSKGSNARLRIGKSQASYWGSWVISLALVLVLLAAGVFFVAVGLVWVAAVKALIILFYFPRLFAYLKRNKPRILTQLKVPWRELGVGV